MSKYRIWEQHGLNYVTLTVVGWIDIFTRQRYRDIVIESLRFCQQQKGLQIVGYVLMSNHLHMIVRTEGYELSNVLRDFKKFTANQILKSIEKEPESRREWLLQLFKWYGQGNSDNTHYQFWQQDSHPIALWTLEVIWQKLTYIHLNPVRAGIVNVSHHYVYSSAGDYYENRKGLLDIELIDPIGPIKPTGYY
jgi:REP element-mobilizing transposase RayT